ncbi:hypothetical protein AGR3A_Cc240020 [Agrobacterium tomkonis CFBP 6623]|uniref:Uncharacterized protein n=1 Tax=Agrobacterium tomkonis CFBP 6623 TaxID=1183432 RepID=A0A1S7PBE1_9HYPH|nr:hypothetical protein AGR3A_Cc240020 [Agrobacterium tomkonis CFBP 6623]
MSVERRGAGEDQPLNACRHCRFRDHAGAIDIDTLKLGVWHAADMRGMKGRGMDYRISPLESSLQKRVVGEIADNMGCGKGRAVYARDIVPAGQRIENRAADPTGAARQHYPHDVSSVSAQKAARGAAFQGTVWMIRYPDYPQTPRVPE